MGRTTFARGRTGWILEDAFDRASPKRRSTGGGSVDATASIIDRNACL
jgi:hypothetical protein